jgi:predicted nucleotidyltransferase
MINDTIIAVKDCILNTVGDNCEKIILFGSYAYGLPNNESDYDFFLFLRDGTEKPILVLQNIYCNLAKNQNSVPIDVLASYKTVFNERSKLPAIERTIAQKGVVLYERN